MVGFHWMRTSSQADVPSTAVRGGVDSDGAAIYVGRAYHGGDWIPAKVVPSRSEAYIAYGGAEISVSDFEILCEQRFDWVRSSNGAIPFGAVEGGKTGDGEVLYIGRAHHAGSETVGKIHVSHGCCYIPYGGEELKYCDYEVLVLRG